MDLNLLLTFFFINPPVGCMAKKIKNNDGEETRKTFANKEETLFVQYFSFSKIYSFCSQFYLINNSI